MGQREEQEKDSWNIFLNSGKVEDYLRYASCRADKCFGGAKESGFGSTSIFHETKEGVKDEPYAGFYSGNRNNSQADSYR